jgi:hypothetical protein
VLRPEEKMRVNGSLNTSVVRFENQGAGHGGGGGGGGREGLMCMLRVRRHFLEIHRYISKDRSATAAEKPAI